MRESDIREYMDRLQSNRSRPTRESALLREPSSDQADFAIVCGLAMEREQTIRAFNARPTKIYRDNEVYFRFTMEDPGSQGASIVLASQAEMGMTDAAILTIKLIRDFGPKCVFMTGICGGVRGEVNLGDLVVADPVFDYGFGLVGPDGTMKRDPYQQRLAGHLRALVSDFLDEDHISKVRNEWHSEIGRPVAAGKAHLGPLASGAAVIRDPEQIASIKEGQRKLLAIDMESFGVARAVDRSSSQPNWLIVKGVSDYADPEKDDTVREFAAFASACFVRDFIVTHRMNAWGQR